MSSAIGSLIRSLSASSSPVKWSRSLTAVMVIWRNPTPGRMCGLRHSLSLVDDSRGGPMRTLIKGGTIVNADATTPADVLVDGERIALIGEALEVEADRTLDASGKWIIPGAI